MKYIEEKSLTFMSGCPQKYPSVFLAHQGSGELLPSLGVRRRRTS
jgi:hypothetical protein